MTTYLLKSILCLAILLLVYLLFLEKEKMHRFNRWYLLGSIVFACIVPLISITIQGQPIPVLQDNYFEITGFDNSVSTQSSAVAQKEATNYLVPALLVIYSLITSILLIRFTRNIYRLLSSAAKNKVVVYRGARLVLLKEKVVSHTFLNNIFISEADYADHKIEEELFTHELTHVREKHSWDVIFIELLQTIFWFNPMFIFYKKAIQLNHEYLADDAVIKTYEDVPAYQCLLLEKISLNSNSYLASNFNYSVTKKRLVMMTRNTNRATALLKKLSILPLLASAVFVFSSKTVAQDQTKTVPLHLKLKTVPSTKDSVPKRFAWKCDLPVISAAGTTQADLDEFNAIVARNTTKTKTGRDIITHVSQEDRNRLEAIFKHMNLGQRNEARIGFYRKIDPPAKLVPTTTQLDKWKNPVDYGVWIDGKKVNNEKLNDYKASDFSHYDASNLAYTEKAKRDVMEQYNLKVMYKVQLDLMTNTGYEKYLAENRAEPENTMYYHETKAPDGRKVEWRWMIR